MKNIRYPRLSVATVIIALSVFATASAQSPASNNAGPNPSVPPGIDKTIEIAGVLPLTGDISEYGSKCRKGIELAVEHANGTHAVPGVSLRAFFEDSFGNAKGSVSAAQKATNKGAKIIIGAVSSSETSAMLATTDAAGAVVISPASSSPTLSGMSRYFLRTWPSDVLEGRVLADVSYGKIGLRSVCILYVNNDYGLGLRNEFTKRFKSLGGKVPRAEGYAQGETNFRDVLTKIIADKPDAIYMAGYHKEMAFATKQLRESGSAIQILGATNYGVPELIEIAGHAADGTVYSTPSYEPGNGSKAMRDFAVAFEARFGQKPSTFEANAYDAVMVVVDALKVGKNESLNIVAHIKGLKDYPGASGSLTFDENGDVFKPMAIREIRNGKSVPYEK